MNPFDLDPDALDDVVKVPLMPGMLGALAEAIGGSQVGDGVWHMTMTDPLRRLPLRLGGVDLGTWQVEEITNSRRSGWQRIILTIRRVRG